MSGDLVERTRTSVRDALLAGATPQDDVDAYCFGWLRGALTNRPDSEIADVLRGVLAARDEALDADAAVTLTPIAEDASSTTARIPFHRTAAGHPCRFSYCSTTRAHGACPVCRAEDVMVTPIRVGDVVENVNDLSLDAREVTRIEGAVLWLRGPSGLDIGAFRVENYRPVGRAIADQRAAAVTR